MQNPDSQAYQCPKCKAKPGEPCITEWGKVAQKVHYGRPYPPEDKRKAQAYERAQRTLATSPLRPTATATGIWIGSEFIRQGSDVPYGAWYCPCGEHWEALSLPGVMQMNELYAQHAACRK